MGLLSFFKRRSDTAPAAAASEPIDAVQRARAQARQRLIGAVVLVIVGVIGFPLVFETQPRPIPVDIPIELPRKETAAPLAMPARAPAALASAADAGPAAPDEMITESRENAGRELPASAPASSAVEARPAASRPDAHTESRPPAKPVQLATAASKPEPRPAEAERARELLEGKAAAPVVTGPGRFVVQVGAFTDAGAARETRVKVEKLGLKTYTQVASTAAGNRIRVRVGPFSTRDEADKAQAKARSAGLSAVVLTL